MKNDVELSPVARLIPAIYSLLAPGWDSTVVVVSTIEDEWFVKTAGALGDFAGFDSDLTCDIAFGFNQSGHLASLLIPPIPREQIFS
ncbi:MAG: hypothetical protein ABI162_16030 [Luteolibacter sp.]